jgi:hypothetical protein
MLSELSPRTGTGFNAPKDDLEYCPRSGLCSRERSVGLLKRLLIKRCRPIEIGEDARCVPVLYLREGVEL